MAEKTRIEYIGQYYIHGSEAPKVAPKPQKESKEYSIPLHRFEKVQKIYVDPLAIAGLVLSMVLLASMVFGVMQLQNAWTELENAQQYLRHVENVHTERLLTYHSSYDLRQVRDTALAMGMIPAAQATTMDLTVTMPQPEEEPTMWEDILWFARGLFA